MPWNNPLAYPVVPPALPPAPIQKDYRWQVVMNVEDQAHSSYLTRNPGLYNGQDIVVGQWIANLTTGQAWQIISIESKSTTQVTAIVQDVYRYNTFRDQAQVGNGSPLAGAYYVVFGVGDTGSPEIDPVPPAGTSATFSQNLISRFEYINLQYDYPLYQPGNTFVMNDVIAADSITNSFVLANATNKLVVGRVTSISDTIPGWFTINPVQKIVDNLDWLPGSVGDIIYSSTTIPGGITTTPGGSEIYIKLRDNTSSVSLSTESGPTLAGNVFQLNSVDITVSGAGTSLTVRGNTTLTLESGTGDTTMALPSGTGSKVTVSGPTAADYATGLADADLVNKKYVDDAIATGAAAGSIKAVTATVSLSAAGSTNVGAALPAGATVLSVKVNVTAADTATGTLVVGKAGGSQYMTASENDTQTTGLYMAECYVVEAASEQVQATVAGTPGGSGSATVIVTYKVAG